MDKLPDVDFADFLKVDIRLGTVIKAEINASARKAAYAIWLDFGPDIGVKKTSAQITAHYQPEALIGRQFLAVVNFPAKQIGSFRSECLLLGVADSKGGIILVGPDQVGATNGARLH